MRNAVIKGSGHYLPEKIVKNAEFLNHEFYDEKGERITKPNEETIEKFRAITEIEERRYADVETETSDMAAIAGRKAIEDAGIDAETLDYVIVASNYGDIDNETQTPDFLPSMSARVKHKLGIKNPKCRPYDMLFGCPGWVEAMILATQFIKAKLANNILVIGCDKLSAIIDPYDRNALIFSDGAGAVILCAEENSKEQGVLNYDSLNFSGEELNYLFSGCSLNPNTKKYHKSITMKGRKVYEFALKHVPSAMKSVIDASGTKIEEVKKILIHQANAKMDHAMVQRLYRLYGIRDYSKDVAPMTVQKFGNSSVATVPTMFDIIRREELGDHRFHSGDKIVMASVGAGMNINALIYKMP